MGRIDPRRGGSMIYVIMLMTMFVILSTGFLYMSRYSLEAVLQNRSYMEAQAAAKMIHQSYCLDVSSGSSAAMNRIWEEFEEDCLSLAGRRGAAELTEALEALEYRANGYGETGDLAVEMVLTARPARGEATVDTQVTRHGYTFRLGAEIRFDDAEGEVLIIPLPQEDEQGEDGAQDEGEPDSGLESDEVAPDSVPESDEVVTDSVPESDAEPTDNAPAPDAEDPQAAVPDSLRFNMQGLGVYRYYEGERSR
ncbi:hypothetical protein [Enterocloster lavalensis]|uniref:hypothetical protein n=1 Tax=Enterocloster lavalensis TaxID=460384 RepID=UPI0023F3DE57|nr:hypothetical protein [Enterocloster lavalensis]